MSKFQIRARFASFVRSVINPAEERGLQMVEQQRAAYLAEQTARHRARRGEEMVRRELQRTAAEIAEGERLARLWEQHYAPVAARLAAQQVTVPVLAAAAPTLRPAEFAVR